MIVRTWTSTVTPDDADNYLAHLIATGAADYAQAEGNLGVEILRNDRPERTEIMFISRWATLEQLREHIGDDTARAIAYPGDEHYAARPSPTATNYTVAYPSSSGSPTSSTLSGA